MGNLVLWLGAGFSKDAGGPLGSELLEPSIVSRSKAKSNAIEALKFLQTQSAWGGLSVEEVFSKVWREANLGTEIAIRGSASDSRVLLRQVKLHLASVSRLVRPYPHSEIFRTYERLLGGLWANNKRLTIITTNFDMLVERVLTKSRIPFDYGDGRSIRLQTPRVKGLGLAVGTKTHLLKLHGSANWGVCEQCGARHAFDREYMPLIARRGCDLCDGRLEIDIVPPIKSKGAELRGLAPLWKIARRHIKEGDRLVVIGYSLPEADEDAKDLMSIASHGSIALRSTIVSGSDPQVRERYLRALPSAVWTGLLFGEATILLR